MPLYLFIDDWTRNAELLFFFADLFEERKMAAGSLDNIWCFVCKSFPSCFKAVYLKGLLSLILTFMRLTSCLWSLVLSLLTVGWNTYCLGHIGLFINNTWIASILNIVLICGTFCSNKTVFIWLEPVYYYIWKFCIVCLLVWETGPYEAVIVTGPEQRLMCSSYFLLYYHPWCEKNTFSLFFRYQCVVTLAKFCMNEAQLSRLSAGPLMTM